MIRSALALALGLSLLGCEAVRAGARPELAPWAHRPSWSISVLYQRPLLAPSRQRGEPYERGRPTLDVAGRRVFVGSSDNGLYSVRAVDGQVLWRFETLGAVQCEPLYDAEHDVLYFGSNDGALYKVRASDGALLWRFSTNAEVARRPTIHRGTLYVVNANDTVIALDPETGKRRWSQHRSPALGMEVAGYAGALVWRGLVYAAFSDGTLTAYDALTGDERWSPVDLSAEAEESLGDVPAYLDVDTTPVAGSVKNVPAVFVGSYEGGVFGLDAETGTILWSNPAVRGVSEVTLWTEPQRAGRQHAMLIASTGTTGLWGLDPETGSEVWRRDLPTGGVSAPAPVAGALLFSTTRQGLFLVSPLDGGIIDGIHNDLGFSMPAAAAGQRAFIMSNGGHLLSLFVTAPHQRPQPRRSLL